MKSCRAFIGIAFRSFIMSLLPRPMGTATSTPGARATGATSGAFILGFFVLVASLWVGLVLSSSERLRAAMQLTSG